MGANCFEDLKQHWGHQIECVVHGEPGKEVNAALECVTCGEVLVSYNEAEPENKKRKREPRRANPNQEQLDSVQIGSSGKIYMWVTPREEDDGGLPFWISDEEGCELDAFSTYGEMRAHVRYLQDPKANIERLSTALAEKRSDIAEILDRIAKGHPWTEKDIEHRFTGAKIGVVCSGEPDVVCIEIEYDSLTTLMQYRLLHSDGARSPWIEAHKHEYYD